MNYENEFNFLCNILKKCYIRTSMISPLDNVNVIFDPQLRSIIGEKTAEATLQNTVGGIENTTRYTLTTELKLRYTFIRLPLLSEKNIFLIGPYLPAPLAPKDIPEIGEQIGLLPGAQKILKEYYSSIPILPDDDRIFSMIDVFCEYIWQTPSFAIVDVIEDHTLSISPIDTALRGKNFDEILANAELMEKRYAFENEMIQAVVLGQQHKKKMFAAAFSDKIFESRLRDPLRNAKNYCIIMNTLLRKAAEQGGVPPIYIDRISSKIAAKIESISDAATISELMQEIFSSYCYLVHKYSNKQYSPIVKKTVLLIDTDISAELSLSSLAQTLGISSGYLATIFKKETGKTVSEYIRDRRISHALYLLNTTHLQIQTVAMHCGIMDVQYFSKIFKKKIGKTPKEYRQAIRR